MPLHLPLKKFITKKKLKISIKIKHMRESYYAERKKQSRFFLLTSNSKVAKQKNTPSEFQTAELRRRWQLTAGDGWNIFRGSIHFLSRLLRLFPSGIWSWNRLCRPYWTGLPLSAHLTNLQSNRIFPIFHTTEETLWT